MSVLHIEINAGDTIQIGDARITLVDGQACAAP